MDEATPDATYIGHRLTYDRVPEATFDPLGNLRYLFECFKQALIFIFIWAFCDFVGFILFALLALLTRSLAVFNFWFYGDAIIGIVLTAVWWFRKVPVLLSEWKYSVDYKGAADATAFAHINWSLQNRRTPIESIKVRRITQPGVPTRDYLELQDGVFTGYVSCFAYGEDLYIGWTLWLYLSPIRYVLTALGRVYHALRFKVSELYLTFRYENARAMREAMHSAAREGINVALGKLAAQGQGTMDSVR